MKTTILNRLALIVLAFVVIIISSSRPAKATDANAKVTELASVKNIQKIILNGNVEVFLTQGITENLRIYDDYYSKNALVQWENGELRISSFEDHKLSVWITVKNLSDIEANGNSVIRTTNKLSSVDLNVNLLDGAKAKLDARVYNLNTHVSGSSKLEMRGEAENQQITLSDASVYESVGLNVQNRSISISDRAEASYYQDGKVTSIKSAKALSPIDGFVFEPSI
ncbi:GIN domain-containing protein [Daejeonella oryzae]|uniref:GIN domain-containing protein n=1 Tax=Daejeonella oryzae TaxID=1122943 RepID=UPI00042829BC|nr:DUF2807 domain-containing protein [Daejeonella oryzae]